MLEVLLPLLLLVCALAVYAAYRRRDRARLPGGVEKAGGGGGGERTGSAAAVTWMAEGNEDSGQSRDGGDPYFDDFAAVETLLEQGSPREALQRIETMLTAYPHEDHDRLLYSVSICFDGLTEGFEPEAVVGAFDALSANSPAFKAALGLYGLDDFTDALAASFVNLPDDDITAKTLRKALAFVREPHPLILKTVLLYDEQAAEYLNSLAKYVFDDWDEDGTAFEAVVTLLDSRLA